MARPRILPDKSVLQDWLRQGLTQKQMVQKVYELTGETVTTMAISVALHRYGLSKRPKKVYTKEIPWAIKVEHSNQTPVRMLRLLGRRRAGEPLSAKETLWLDNWLQRLKDDNAVVAYDPETGFHYVEREKGDQKAIPIRPYEIRLNNRRR